MRPSRVPTCFTSAVGTVTCFCWPWWISTQTSGPTWLRTMPRRPTKRPLLMRTVVPTSALSPGRVLGRKPDAESLVTCWPVLSTPASCVTPCSSRVTLIFGLASMTWRQRFTKMPAFTVPSMKLCRKSTERKTCLIVPSRPACSPCSTLTWSPALSAEPATSTASEPPPPSSRWRCGWILPRRLATGSVLTMPVCSSTCTSRVPSATTQPACTWPAASVRPGTSTRSCCW
jgi:hypothetical protein